MERVGPVTTLPGVCEIERFGPKTGSETPPALLIEVPHGATSDSDFDAALAALAGPVPADLRDFFHVNTDVGAPECAVELARGVAAPPDRFSAVVLRCLVPRTFCDCNRELGTGTEHYAASGITPAIPEYVGNQADRELLASWHRSYCETASGLYTEVCGNGGLAVILHSYAPRSVQIGSLDVGIVAALREAYEPDRYSTWVERPPIDLITADQDGRQLAAPDLVEEVKAAYRRLLAIEPTENASYCLHPSTLGYRHSARFPGRVLCLEVRRDLVAEPYRPFDEMAIGPEKVRSWIAPLIEGIRRSLPSV